MDHLILNNGSDSAALAELALKALREARRSKTSRSGSIFVSDGQTDADGIDLGTGTIINGVNGGIQPWVGDTTHPGKPTGLTASSRNAAITVMWDGTLYGGIPADFHHITVTGVRSSDSASMTFGDLSSAGSLSMAELTAGDEWTITAIAYDDAHLADGTSSPNASGPSDAVTVTVESAVSADEVQAIQSDLSKAQSDIAAAEASMTDLTKKVSTVDGKVTTSGSAPTTGDASGKPDGAMWYVMDANGNITATYILKSGSWVKYAWASTAISDEVNQAISDAASKASTAQSTADAAKSAAETNTNDLTSFINETTDKLSSLQSQVDGSITTWFYGVAPTTSNKPASDWTTTDLKNNHLGDLYYDTITGYCYRYQVSNNTYSWARISDVDVTKALSDAAKAQDTADAKRRVFTGTPTTPYDVGDLWVQGASGDILTCSTAKTGSQSYNASDWKLASKYTDDTLAYQAHQAAVTAQSSASTAQTAADNAKELANTAQATADTALANAAELLVNGGFESGLSGWTQSAGAWSTGVLLGPAPLSGKSYAWPTSLPATGPATLTSQPFPVKAGRTYRVLVSAWQYGTRTLTLTITPDAGTATSKTFMTNSSENWVPCSLDVTMPSGVSSATLTLASDSTNLRLDDASVKDITEAAAAQSTANTAQTIAGAAQSAADAANDAAKDAQKAADAAQTTADGKNKVVRSTNAPSSTSGYSNGDQWWVYSGGTVTALYLYSGTAWVSQTLTDSVIANLDAGKITSGYVNADRIKAGSITGAKVAAGTITASNMVAGTLTAASGIIADAAIGSAQIIDGSIGSAEIADAAIKNAKIADAAISTAKIADASITNAKIANLDAGKITSGYVDAARIAADSITADKLAADSVTSDKIVANAVTSEKLVSEAVTADKLAANSVTAVKLAAGSVTADKADIGSLAAAIVSSNQFKTSNGRMLINDDGLTAKDANGNTTVNIPSDGSTPTMVGGLSTASNGKRISISQSGSVGAISMLNGNTELASMTFIDNTAHSGYVYTGLYTEQNCLQFATLVDSANHNPDPLQYDASFTSDGKMFIYASDAINVNGTWFAHDKASLPTSPNVVGYSGTKGFAGGTEYTFDGSRGWSATSHRMFTGSKVITGTGTSEYTFLSNAEYNAIVGRDPTYGDVITFTNGDRAAGVFTSAFGVIDNANHSVNVVFPANISGARRLNYCITCND